MDNAIPVKTSNSRVKTSTVSPEPPIDPDNESTSSIMQEGAKEIRDTLDVIIMMFLMFDKAVQGFISKSELNAIIAAEGTGSGTSAFLSQDRWDEMDWDKDETISFEEFVFAFYAWVDDDEEVDNA